MPFLQELQEPVITWVKVEKPTFDLVGVILSSFKLAGFMLVGAVIVGVAIGTVLVLAKRRRGDTAPLEDISLNLDSNA